ncbi:hypothetical protein PR202_ga13364 [Eleusine coracana subsp. coracana]|uniref:Uncharacterized protein n=1 Tax=Eleusine coracana subsp. coracana TaxID=191504 RepID=A0AAV5CEH4_ELECO|nr:hypothetical protein PR202_ga13364 [Eleusine coracana subsp. coracana]
MSSDPPASSSSSAMASFPKSMKGQRVKVFLPCDCVLVAVEKRKEGFFVKLQADRRLLPDLSVGESIVLEGHGLRLNCHVDSVVEVPETEQLVHIDVRAPNNDVRLSLEYQSHFLENFVSVVAS